MLQHLFIEGHRVRGVSVCQAHKGKCEEGERIVSKAKLTLCQGKAREEYL